MSCNVFAQCWHTANSTEASPSGAPGTRDATVAADSPHPVDMISQ